MATFTCNTDGCVREFPTELAVRMHRNRVHSKTGKWAAGKHTPENLIKCETCGQEMHKSNKARHMREIHGVFKHGPYPPKKHWKQKEAPPLPDMPLSKPSSRTLGELFEKKKVGRHPGKTANRLDRASQTDRVLCPVPDCGKEYRRSSLSTHLRNIHGIYRTAPRDPRNKAKVKQIVGRMELNVQKLPPGNSTALIATRHLEVHHTNGNESPALDTPDNTQYLALRIQALIQIAEMIVKL